MSTKMRERMALLRAAASDTGNKDQWTLDNMHAMAHEVHDHAVALGAKCDTPMSNEKNPDGTNPMAGVPRNNSAYTAPNPYTKDIEARQLAANGPSPVVLSAAERNALGPYANDVARMRSLNR